MIVKYWDNKFVLMSTFEKDFFCSLHNKDHSSHGLMSVSMATQLYAA